MKRLCIYFFYDKDGVVDRYIEYVLKNIKNCFDKIIVVSNGEIKHGKSIFENNASSIIERENKGFDVWAYKTALESEGWDNLLRYDEVVLMNYTIMGPVHSVDKMFDEMQSRKVDFWGITKCFEERNKAAVEMWKCPYNYIPEHIQSSFMVFRKEFIASDEFQKYWTNMPMINSYYEAGGKHEQVFTKYFSDLGHKWDCYTNLDDMNKRYVGCAPLITEPLEVVKNKKSPFFKRRTFFTMKNENFASSTWVKDFLDYLKDETDYDTDMIMENLIRTCNQRDLVENLVLYHVI